VGKSTKTAILDRNICFPDHALSPFIKNVKNNFWKVHIIESFLNEPKIRRLSYMGAIMGCGASGERNKILDGIGFSRQYAAFEKPW